MYWRAGARGTFRFDDRPCTKRTVLLRRHAGLRLHSAAYAATAIFRCTLKTRPLKYRQAVAGRRQPWKNQYYLALFDYYMQVTPVTPPGPLIQHYSDRDGVVFASIA